MEEQGRWPNLSNDILSLILKRLHTQSDLCRFRSICKSWRSFASPSQPHILFPLSLPPFNQNSRPFSLSPTLLYILSPQNPTNNNNNVWLIKAFETGQNRWTLLNPLTNDKLYFRSGVFRQRINLMGFKNYEVGRSYKLQSVGDLGENTFDFGEFSSLIARRRVAVKTLDGFVVVVLNGCDEIWVWKFGDEKWVIIQTGENNDQGNKKESDFFDVVCYDGKFYAVDKRGRVVEINTTSFEVSEVVAPLEEINGQYIYVVECNFRLYLVNKVVNQGPVNYYDEEEEEWVVDKTSVGRPMGFKVYVLNERKMEWEKVESIGDRVLFVTRDASFLIRAEDLGWSKGNCIYFEGLTGYDDEADMGFGLNAGVYSLDDQVISTFSSLDDPRAKIFWQPSSWFVAGEDYPEHEMLD